MLPRIKSGWHWCVKKKQEIADFIGYCTLAYFTVEIFCASHNIKAVRGAARHQIQGDYETAKAELNTIVVLPLSKYVLEEIAAAKDFVKAENTRASGDQKAAFEEYQRITASYRTPGSVLFYFVLKFLSDDDLITDFCSFPVEASYLQLWNMKMLSGTASLRKCAALLSLENKEDDQILAHISIRRVLSLRATSLYANLARHICINGDECTKDFQTSLKLFNHALDCFWLHEENTCSFIFHLNPFRFSPFLDKPVCPTPFDPDQSPSVTLDDIKERMERLAETNDRLELQCTLLYIWSIICLNNWYHHGDSATTLKKESAKLAYQFVMKHRDAIKENSYRNCLGMYLNSLGCSELLKHSRLTEWRDQLEHLRQTVFYKKEHVDCINNMVECLFVTGEVETALRLLLYYDMGETEINYDEVLKQAKRLSAETNRYVTQCMGCLLFALKQHEKALEVFSLHFTEKKWYSLLSDFVAGRRDEDLYAGLLTWINEDLSRNSTPTLWDVFLDKYVRSEVLAAQQSK